MFELLIELNAARVSLLLALDENNSVDPTLRLVHGQLLDVRRRVCLELSVQQTQLLLVRVRRVCTSHRPSTC